MRCPTTLDSTRTPHGHCRVRWRRGWRRPGGRRRRRQRHWRRRRGRRWRHWRWRRRLRRRGREYSCSGEVQPEPTRVDRWLDGRPPEGWGDSNSTGRPSAMRTDTRRTDTQRERTGDATLRITRAGRRRSSEGVQPSARPAASRSANEGAARRGDEGTTARRAQGEARRRHARAGGRGARTSAAGSTGRGYHMVLVKAL